MPQHSRTPVIELDDTDWCRLTDVLYGFEEAWKSAPFPDLEAFVPPVTDALRKPTLIELIKVDQERRAQLGQPQPLEAYLAEWPELGGDDDAVAELLEAECFTRTARGDRPTVVELQARLPAVSDRIDLDRIAAEAQPRQSRTHRELAVGTQFGRYEIRGLVAEGSMAAVYRAFDTTLSRDVALKIPRFDPATQREVIDRFLTEAKLLATVQHTHVCPIYDAGEIDGIDYIAMAFLEGQTLKDWLNGRTLPAHQAAELVRKLALALEAVHAAGIIHRDIKPSNVMFNLHGEPILMDFGLARSGFNTQSQRSHVHQNVGHSPIRPRSGERGYGSETASRQSGDNQLSASASFASGTPAYMSPEQVSSQYGTVDARSDIYSLGVLLYQLLTGRLPFTGQLLDVLAGIVTQEPTPPRRIRPELDAALQKVCLKAMAKRPADRYQSAREFSDALDHLLTKPQFVRWPLVAAGLMLAAAIWFSVSNSRREPPPVADSFHESDSNVAGSLREPNASPRRKPSPALGESGPPPHITNAKHDQELPTTPISLKLGPSRQVTYEGRVNETGLFSNERHWFQIETVQPGWLLIEALTLADEVNPELALYDTRFDAIAKDGNSGPGNDAQLAVQVRENEPYHIAVSDAKGENGPYRLLVSQPDEPPPTPPFPDGKLPKDSYSDSPIAAHELHFHATGHAFVVGSIDPVGDEDWFHFTATQTGPLLIKSETPHSSLDTFFQLFRDESQVAEHRERIVVQVTQGEHYRLRMKANEPLKDKGFDPTGNYILRLRQMESRSPK